MRLPARLAARLTVFVLGLALAACDSAAPVDPVPRPTVRPPRLAVAATAERMPSRSGTSLALQEYYARVQDGLLAQGLLRRDGGGADTPFDARRLADTFLQVALYEEYTSAGGRLVQRQTPSRLHRWDQPVRLQLEFGASVPQDKAARDSAALGTFAQRLSRITGRPIETVPSGGNFNVFILNEDERVALGPRLSRLVPGMSRSALASVTEMPRSSYCLVFAVDSAQSGRYSRAVAIIRAEHPDLLRLSCIHEEIAQGLGLSNDSPDARPSVFNDDEEFGLLTTHDEYLLRMLYDPRMRPGMTEAEARPVAYQIARELIGGES